MVGFSPINTDRKIELLGQKWTPVRSWAEFLKFAPELSYWYCPENYPPTYPCLARKEKKGNSSYNYYYLIRTDVENLITKLQDLL